MTMTQTARITKTNPNRLRCGARSSGDAMSTNIDRPTAQLQELEKPDPGAGQGEQDPDHEELMRSPWVGRHYRTEGGLASKFHEAGFLLDQG